MPEAQIHLPDIEPGAEAPTLAELASRGGMIDVFRMLLRSPQIAEAVGVLGAAQFAHSSLTAVDRELAVLAAGRCFEAPYETAQHEPISRAVGVTDEQRAAIASGDWSGPVFSEGQTQMLRFVVAVATSPVVAPGILQSIRRHYDDQQVVELVVQTGYYFLLGRVTTIFDIKPDPPRDARVLDIGADVGRRG